MEEQDQGYQDANTKKFDQVEFAKGDVGEKFTDIIQRILLAPRTTKQSKRHNFQNILYHMLIHIQLRIIPNYTKFGGLKEGLRLG